MKNLHEILKKENYKKVKFKITKTQHLLIKAKINGVAGNFIFTAKDPIQTIDNLKKVW